MTYVDGYVIPTPKKKIAAYKKMATWGKKMWMKHGALQYFECVADDLEVMPGCGGGFKKMVKLKPSETVWYSFVVYRNQAHRNAVNKKVMKDPRILAMMAQMKDKKKSPFDPRQMAYGGFKVIVDA